jgi:hypothetical protein
MNGLIAPSPGLGALGPISIGLAPLVSYVPAEPRLPAVTGRVQGEKGADWTAPFKLPRLSPEKFTEQKAAYVAKYGYTITIPGLTDIIHVKTINPMSEEEKTAWRKKDYASFSEARYAELKEDKDKKRAHYLAMLASPSPDVLKNAGAILTSIDNAQDALTTLSVLGRLGIKFAPRILGKAMTGPVGWIMTAADILNVAMTLGRMLTMPMMGKRVGNQATELNPFSKSAKIKRAAKLMRAYPSIGNLIEVAQTTDNVFGIGLCLGPIVGLIQDIAIGSVRSLFGQKVKVKMMGPHTSPALYTAATVPKATTLIFASGYKPDDELLLQLTLAHYLSLQELHGNNEGWNALDAVEDIKTSQISVPVPSNLLSLEVMEEEGHAKENFGGWPHSNKQWAIMDDIVNTYSVPGNDFLSRTMEAHKHDWLGHVVGSLLTQSHQYAMANLEGDHNLNINYTEQSKFLDMMMKAGKYPDPDQPPAKIKELEDLIVFNDFNGMHMKTTEYVRFMRDRGIKTLKMCA